MFIVDVVGLGVLFLEGERDAGAPGAFGVAGIWTDGLVSW